MHRAVLAGVGVVLAFGPIFVGCKKQEPEGSAPPPIQSSQPGVCASGGGTVGDAKTAAFFPRVAGDYCIDPNGEARSYGEDAKGSVDEVCTQLFDGECETYKSFGLTRVVTLRYADGRGSPGSVSITLSRFSTKPGAYAFFTKRVVADADPKLAAPPPLDAGGAGALGTGIAYVWRGEHVAELAYTNEIEAPADLAASSARVLPPLARELGEKLPGDKAPPEAVSALPKDHLLPLGVSYVMGDVLDVKGAGAGAIGFYEANGLRWRILVAVRPEEASAKDVMTTLGKAPGAKSTEKPFSALRLSSRADESSPIVEWVVARKGAVVYGVGDEIHALRAADGEEEKKKISLGTDDKMARLGALTGGS